LKKLIKKYLGLVGYELRRKARPAATTAFTVQQSFIDKKEPVIFDVGAAVGTVTGLYRDIFPHAVIHSFEPFPDSFQQLEKKIAGDSRIFAHNLAVADKTASVLFYDNISPLTNSLLEADSRWSDYWGGGKLENKNQLEVEAVTLDDFCAKNNIPEIDILKLDIQGAEHLALTGAARMLEEQAIALIYSEIIMAPTYRG